MHYTGYRYFCIVLVTFAQLRLSCLGHSALSMLPLHSYTCNVLVKSELFWLPRIDCLSKRGRVTRFFGFILSFQNQTHLGRWLTGKKDLQIIAFSRRYSQNWVDKKMRENSGLANAQSDLRRAELNFFVATEYLR